MKQNWNTFGHETNKELLERQMSSGHLAHAYLFVGPSGIGKKVLARELAQKLLETERLETHPDFHTLETTGDIPVEAVRVFLSKLATKPFMSSKVVAIIDNADTLTAQSSNALLKTLEEPGKDTIIILIASRLDALPTVISRCQVMRFYPFAPEQLGAYAKQVSLKVVPEVINYSMGSIGRLQSLATDSELLVTIKNQLDRIQEVPTAPTSDKLLAVQEFGELDLEPLRDLLRAWIYGIRPTLNKYPERFSLIQSILEGLNNLNGSINKKLVLERLFLASA